MKLTLEAARGAITEIDLGEPSETSIGGYYDNGDLTATGGNLYIHLDGKEYGSLFFFRKPDGTVQVVLGQFDAESQDWQERNPLNHPVDAEPQGTYSMVPTDE